MNAIVPAQHNYAYMPNWTRWQPRLNEIACMDALTYAEHLPSGSVNCCVTSPPYYGLRSYLPDDHRDKHMEIGLDDTPAKYIDRLVTLFREIRRALRDDGVVWLNLGDSYANHKDSKMSQQRMNKDRLSGQAHIISKSLARTQDARMLKREGFPDKSLMLIPHRVAIALQADGWHIRNDIVWSKISCMPESVKDRFTRSHEYIFLLSKNKRYWFDADAVAEPAGNWGTRDRSMGKYTSEQANEVFSVLPGGHHSGLRGKPFEGSPTRNRRTVWTINPKPFPGSHFAVFPDTIPEICIKAGCPPGGVVYDPFMGSGTTALVAQRLDRNFYGSELSREYQQMATERIRTADPYQPTQVSDGIEQLSLFAS